MIKLALAVGFLAVFGIAGYAIVVKIFSKNKNEENTNSRKTK